LSLAIPGLNSQAMAFYFAFTFVPTFVNVPLRFVPTVVTAAMIAVEISAAIKPYSIAVAPDSSFRNLETSFMTPSTDRHHPNISAFPA
jgi:hypothetical protein